MRAPTALPFGIPSVICASGGAVALGERDTREAISRGSSSKWWVVEGSTCVVFIAPGGSRGGLETKMAIMDGSSLQFQKTSGMGGK